MNITVFVDESGTISHDIGKCEDYFIITLLFVNDTQFLKKVFKKERLKIANKKPRLKQLLQENKEIKGSEINETLKNPIYKTLISKCNEHFELGIIILDMKKCDDHFRSNSSRAFNYLIKRYLETHFKRYSKFKEFDTIDFIIDERNVATGARFLLEEYLNTELNLIDKFANHDMNVGYYNSNKFHLLQLADFLANTYYRFYQKHNVESTKNIKLLKETLCHSTEYKFPLS